MKQVVLFALGMLFVASAFGQAIPPMNLAAEVLTDGEVELTWEEPPAGLAETFDNDPGASWNWLVQSITFDDGYAKIDGSASNTWQTGAYEEIEFSSFDLESTFEIQDGSTSSRGVMWCVNGPRDADFQGYGMYISNTSWSVWKYTNGSASSVISWSTGTGINTGQGAVNTMNVQGSNGTYDLYINGTYHNSFTDNSYPEGYVGVIEAYNVTWYDEITCIFTAAPDAVPAPAQPGEPVAGYFDDMGNPVNEPLPVAENVRVFDRYGQGGGGNALDELVGFNIYRDGNLVGSVGATTFSYVDTMPTLWETYEYTVTADYDPEGESGPAGPISVTWDAVYFSLTGVITEIPANGGTLFYDASVINTLGTTFNQGVTYKTFLNFPNGQFFGPISTAPVTISAYLNTTVQGLSLTLPALAPAGEYIFTGRLGTQNTYVEDTFTFTKLGAGAESVVTDPATWPQNSTLAFEDQTTPVEVPVEFAMSAAYPNPFNPTTSVSITMPEAGELSLTVYNIQGQVVATLSDGRINAGSHQFTVDASGLASGLYFIRASVPGQLNQVQKVTLLQ
ncbi:T9SS type A sorting domain-containing protein [bacterium]|nr:T9SS type A sorting domain-containing protein [bacterium]